MKTCAECGFALEPNEKRWCWACIEAAAAEWGPVPAPTAAEGLTGRTQLCTLSPVKVFMRAEAQNEIRKRVEVLGIRPVARAAQLSPSTVQGLLANQGPWRGDLLNAMVYGLGGKVEIHLPEKSEIDDRTVGERMRGALRNPPKRTRAAAAGRSANTRTRRPSGHKTKKAKRR